MEIKTWTLGFPAKENPNMEKALFDWPIVLQYDVKAKYRLISRKFFGHEVFSPERLLNQPKATRVCIRSINQSNRSISVRFLFLFCSRVFISRSYKNRSIKRIRDFWANGVLHASWYFTQAISSYATMQWMPRYFYFQSFRNKVYRTHPWPAPIVFDGLPASLLSYTTDTSIAKPCFVDVYNIWTLLLLTGRF